MKVAFFPHAPLACPSPSVGSKKKIGRRSWKERPAAAVDQSLRKEKEVAATAFVSFRPEQFLEKERKKRTSFKEEREGARERRRRKKRLRRVTTEDLMLLIGKCLKIERRGWGASDREGERTEKREEKARLSSGAKHDLSKSDISLHPSTLPLLLLLLPLMPAPPPRPPPRPRPRPPPPPPAQTLLQKGGEGGGDVSE